MRQQQQQRATIEEMEKGESRSRTNSISFQGGELWKFCQDIREDFVWSRLW